jgi:hypothetical protein
MLVSRIAAAELGAVVDMLTVTAELPLPDKTCVGLKVQDVNAGRPEQETLKSFGKAPVRIDGDAEECRLAPRYRNVGRRCRHREVKSLARQCSKRQLGEVRQWQRDLCREHSR